MKTTKGNVSNIHQCLYGYDDGHRLLSSSLILDSKVQLELLKKSDVAPNMSEVPKNGYYSGFPIVSEKKYALMKTWDAPEMSRPGCVWSHVLLISFSDLEFIEDLECLEKLFLRPEGDRPALSNYLSPLSIENKKFYSPSLAFDEYNFFEIINSIYSNSSPHPFIYCQSPEKYMRDVYVAWSQQWPKLRRTFTFYTVGKLNANLQESYSKNDLVFVIDKNKSSHLAKESNWNTELANWMEIENSELKEFLWQFGGFFRDGRNKFQIILKLYRFARNKKEIINFDSLFLVLANSKLESAEVLYSLEYFLPKNTQNKKKALVNFTYNVIEFFPSYYKYFNDELLLQFSLGNVMSSLSKDDIGLLVSSSLISSGYGISRKLLEESDIRLVFAVALNDPLLIDYVVDSRKEVVLIDDFYLLSDTYVLSSIERHWFFLDDKEKFNVANKACELNRLNILSILMEGNYTSLIDLFSTNKKVMANLYESPYKSIFIDFLVLNSNSLAFYESESFILDLLMISRYNKQIVDSIPVHSIVNALNSKVSNLNEWDRFNFFSFSYYRFYLNDDDYTLPALVVSFLELHQLLSRNLSDSCGWNMLNEIMPLPLKNREWDECMRLRLSIIRFCQKNPAAAKNIIGLIKEDKKILKKIFDDLMEYIKDDSGFYFPEL